MKKTLKRKSKRIPTRQRVKAEKKVREHNRKVRKEKKQNPGKFLKKSRKNISVPNDCPFKENILLEVEDARKRKEAEKLARRSKILEAAKAKAGDRVNVANITELAKIAKQKDKEFEQEAEVLTEDEIHCKHERSGKNYYKEFTKVVETADVLLEVLDARDPLGTRSPEVEKQILGQAGKRLVLVLTKADLVPKENLEKWVKYFQRELPAIPFKSSTQKQAHHLGQNKKKISKLSEEQMQTSKSVGVTTLMTLLGNYCRNKDIKTSIRVGVVGYPNVGKSSLINSLKRGKVCLTGNKPGVTKVMQEIQLDKKIKLIDCPGMILNPSKSSDKDDIQAALRNAVNLDLLLDYLTPVEAILQRIEKRYMQMHYSLPNYDSTEEFLALVAREKGKLSKGGVPDLEASAKMILNDWNSGRIKYFTHPPEKPTFQLDAKIVNQYAKEFCLDDLETKMEEDVQAPSETVQLKPSVSVQPKPVSQKVADQVSEKILELGSEAPPRLKKLQKLREKKEKKKRNRSNKLTPSETVELKPSVSVQPKPVSKKVADQVSEKILELGSEAPPRLKKLQKLREKKKRNRSNKLSWS